MARQRRAARKLISGFKQLGRLPDGPLRDEWAKYVVDQLEYIDQLRINSHERKKDGQDRSQRA